MRKSIPSLKMTGIFLLMFGLFAITSCKKDDKPLSKLAGLTAYSIKDVPVAFEIDEATKTISNADSLPFQTDVSSLVAMFTAVPNSKVTVGGAAQVSGTTVNDFSQPLQYVVTAQDGVSNRTYTVRVNVAQVDPKTISWQQLTPDAGWGNNHTNMVATLNDKFYMIGLTGTNFASYVSSDATTWARTRAVDNNGDSVPLVEHPAFISFNDKLWILGGLAPGVGWNWGDVTNKVWSSSDGLAWTASEPTVATDRWSKRERIGAVVFKDKLWVIGGNAYPYGGNTNMPGSAYNDVWSSSDGTTWSQANANAAFVARTNPAVFVYKDKMWVVGGKDNGGNYLNDVWNSADGVTWNEVTVNTPFTGRLGHQIVVNNDQLFLVGGEYNKDNSVSNELWVSENEGVDWTKIEQGDVRALPNNFKARKDFSMFVHDGAVYIAGGLGYDGTTYTFPNDILKGNFQ